ncbi:MAG: sn-glycerol-3-phosphate ABC transporter ATP-binding protein UgpC [Elusimicrobia bacterium]|nr:sn-glycerol-3-phosphate ABC transporter ATP-binding protein UgpC [Elusimicrobiota bacterium]
MARVSLQNVTKRFGDTVVVKDVSLEIPDKEFCVLVGPSGCGKSTTLRMIAGLEEVTEGEIWIGDRLVNDIPPKDRDIAMVFQNYALYPHMTVYQNMAFGLKLRGYSRREIDARVREAAEILNLDRFLERKPKALSGGQRQRVAVGRAIVRKPKVFLFDEPLSNLDAKLRVQMRAELQKLHHRLQTTMVYVTHDQVEAMTMGDRICVMRDGVIQQIDTPLGVYNHPINKFVAGFIGSPPMNFIKVAVVQEGEEIWLDEGQFSVRVPAAKRSAGLPYVGREVVLGIRPEDIYDKLLYGNNSTEGKIVSGTVEVVEPMGNEILLFLVAGRHPIVARVTANNEAQVNQEIELIFQMDKAHLFDLDTERQIF